MKTELMMFVWTARRAVRNLALVAAVAVAFGAWADDTWTDPDTGYTWTYRINGDTAEIYAKSSVSVAISPKPNGAVTIPSTLGGKPVTSIGEYAFESCIGLTEVMIPNCVTNIGMGVFYGCDNLQSLTIPNIGASQYIPTNAIVNVSYYEWGDYRYCSTDGSRVGGLQVLFLRKGQARTLTFDNLGTWDSPHSEAVTVYDLSGSVPRSLEIVMVTGGTEIVSEAFLNCASINTIRLAETISGIGSSAFSGCSGLTSVTIPNSVTSIGDFAFRDCSGLTSVTIPDGVSGIGYGVFSGCKNLSSVTFGVGLSSLNSSAFYGAGVTSFSVAVDNPNYKAVSGLLLTKDGTTLVRGVKGIANIPASVTNILDSAFYDTGVISFSVTDDNPSYKAVSGLLLSKNGETLVRGGNGIATIPYGVVIIGKNAFNGCSGLTSVTIPNSVTNVETGAFNGCLNVESLTIPFVPDGEWDTEGYYGYGKGFKSGLDRLLGFPYQPEDQYQAPLQALRSVVISGQGGIGVRALYKYEGLTEVKLLYGVTNIGSGAFWGCSGLTSVTIPSGVTNIGNRAFMGCSGLTSVTIPNTVVSIEEYAFFECSGLTQVIIPDSVTSVGEVAFGRCGNLHSVWLPSRFEGRDVSSQFNTSADYNPYSGHYSVHSDGITFSYYDSTCNPRFIKVLESKIATSEGGATSIEVVVTNACKVLFSWKCSCEPMRKGKMYDYLSFSVDGDQLDAICGEVDWTNMMFEVSGEGEHVLTWTYRKDESGNAGEDCGLIRLVQIAPRVILSFLPGGAVSGTPPAPMTYYANDGVVSLPGLGSLSLPKHTFLGWSNGRRVFLAGSDYPCDADVTELTAAWKRNELAAPAIKAPTMFYQSETAMITISAERGATICYTLDGSMPTAESLHYGGPFAVSETTTIRAIAVKDDYFDSEEATLTVTKDPTTYGDAVNAPTFAFSSNDGTGWRIACGESPDGLALRSGPISHNATSRLEAVVLGEGVVTFSVKVAGEIVKGDVYDGLAFLIDGVQQGELMGNTEWTTNTYSVVGEGVHTLSWLYIKDEGDDEPVVGDCAWLDEFKWVSMQSVVITFNSNGGTVVTPGSQDYVPGQTFGNFPVPTRRGYTFQGWWTEPVNGIRMTEATAVPAADMELFAHWEPITYYVRFHANGGTGADVDQAFVFDGQQALATHTFTRTGFAFSGWATTQNGQVRYAENASVVNLGEVQDEIVDLYAVWSGVGYSIRFDSNGGTGVMDNQTIAVGVTQKLRPCAFVRAGYAFAGWALSPTDAANGTVRYRDGEAVKDLATSNGAIVPLYAVWIPVYTINFHRNDASDGKTAAYEFDYGVETRIPSLNSLGWARRGLDFLGWATSRANADAGKVWKKDWAVVTTAAAVGKTLDVYAVWALKPGSYAIEFIRNDGAGTWRTVGFNYGEKTRMPSVANGLKWARRGYEFKGWALTTADAAAGKVWKGDWAYVSTPVAAGKTLTAYAVWALKPGFYQVRYNKNDGTGKWRSLGYEYGVSTKLSTVKALGWSVSGKTFKGWATSAANASAGKVWKADGAAVSTAADAGKTVGIYAIWQ